MGDPSVRFFRWLEHQPGFAAGKCGSAAHSVTGLARQSSQYHLDPRDAAFPIDAAVARRPPKLLVRDMDQKATGGDPIFKDLFRAADSERQSHLFLLAKSLGQLPPAIRKSRLLRFLVSLPKKSHCLPHLSLLISPSSPNPKIPGVSQAARLLELALLDRSSAQELLLEAVHGNAAAQDAIRRDWVPTEGAWVERYGGKAGGIYEWIRERKIIPLQVLNLWICAKNSFYS